MKKLLIIIILLITAGLIAPKFIGNIVATEHKLMLDKLNENPAIDISYSNFNQGWFGGKASFVMKILLQDDEFKNITLTIEENLSFGPIIFTEQGLEFALSYTQADINFKEALFDEEFDEEIANFIRDKIHLTGLLTFSKNADFTVIIDEMSKEIDGNSIVSSRAVLAMTLENSKRIFGEFTWDGLQVNTSEENFTVGKTIFTVDQAIIAGDYYKGNAISTGDFHFEISSVTANDPQGNEGLLIKNLTVSAMSEVNDDLMKVNVNYGIEAIKASGQDLKNANLNVVFDGLNIKVIQEANAFFTSISNNDEDMFNTQNMAKISALVIKLLANEPVLKISELSVETPEGKIKSAMEVTIDQNAFDASNLMSIIGAVQANADGKAPLAFFAKLGLVPMIDIYIEQGFLLKNEQDLIFKANYAQGQLNINGNVIPL